MRRAKDVFTAKMFGRLFVPSLCASFGLAFSDMADALVVGLRMGETGLAAIGMTLPLFMAINLFMHGFGIGGSVRYSQLLGAGRADEAVRSFNQVLQWALAVGFVIALVVNLFPATLMRLLGATGADALAYDQTLTYARVISAGAPIIFLNYVLNYYLRSDDQQKRASIGFLAGTLVDIGLNALLVLALNMDILGAALATLAGSLVAVLVYLPGLIRHKRVLRFARFRPSAREALTCFKTGISSSVQYVYQLVFLLIANHTLLGISGETGVAVFDMVQNASYLITYLYDAAGKALQPLASTFYGEKNRAAVKRALGLALKWGLGCGIVAAIALSAFPEAVCAAFGLSGAQALGEGARALRIYCLSSAFAGISMTLETYFQSIERERDAFVIATLRGCAVLLPATLLFALLSPGEFWWVYPVVEAISLGAYLLWRKIKPAPADPFPAERILPGLIRSRTEDLAGLLSQIEEFCECWGATPRQQYYVTMAVEEISVAIIDNAFGQMRDGYIQITLIACEDNDFELHIRDNASFFNPFSLETNKVSEDGDYDMDAMGMMVVKNQAKTFFYRQYQCYNTLVVRI